MQEKSASQAYHNVDFAWVDSISVISIETKLLKGDHYKDRMSRQILRGWPLNSCNLWCLKEGGLFYPPHLNPLPPQAGGEEIGSTSYQGNCKVGMREKRLFIFWIILLNCFEQFNLIESCRFEHKIWDTKRDYWKPETKNFYFIDFFP